MCSATNQPGPGKQSQVISAFVQVKLRPPQIFLLMRVNVELNLQKLMFCADIVMFISKSQAYSLSTAG
jgi:hypothetical protein